MPGAAARPAAPALEARAPRGGPMASHPDTTDAPAPAPFGDRRRRVLVLYDHHWMHVKTVVHYLEGFHRFSRHAVSFATSYARCDLDLAYFDAVVIHYSVKVCYPGHLSASFAAALKAYDGLK